MAFKSFSVSLGDSDTDVVECPATQQGAAVIMVGNTEASPRTFSLKLYRQASGITTTIASGVTVAANAQTKVAAPLSLEAGDKIVMVASASDALTASGTFTFSAATPAAVGFTPLGEWSDVATYAINDVVSLNGTSYISLQNGNTNQDPETETAYWMVLSERGPMGIGDMIGANNLSEITNPATARDNLGLGSSSTPEFADVNLGHASDTTLSRSAAGKLAVEGHVVLTHDEEGQGPITGGAGITPKNLGTVGTGTLTVDPSARSVQVAISNGATTLGELSQEGACVLWLTMSSGAEIPNTAAWDRVDGDAFTVTNGHKFRIHMERVDDYSYMFVRAMQ